MNPKKKALLLILDGWGLAPQGAGNCVTNAATPYLDSLFEQYPHTKLNCSGRAVGLPDGFMGNSEVGHMNIGAGRVVYQDMTRIDMAIEDQSFFTNPTLTRLMERTKAKKGRLHLMGLLSDGGVHSHQNHIYALLKMAKGYGLEVIVHCFMDGRDTPPSNGKSYIQQLMTTMESLSVGKVGVVVGRYYAMDRDNHFERNELAYRALVDGDAPVLASALEGIDQSYSCGENDEFIKPFIVGSQDRCVKNDDGIFFFNFRADRARQICKALFDPTFDGFSRGPLPELADFATMTRYESSFPMPVAFAPESYESTLGQVVSENGLTQLRIAETEKYAHVTYFLNCGREDPFPGENRIMVQSPRDVATYDLKPEMSAEEVTTRLVAAMRDHDLCICNFANLDMVGHTGIIDATLRACSTIDACVKRVVEAMLQLGGSILLTADHGNAEEMLGPDGGPQTSHSTNPVPLVFIGRTAGEMVLESGGLSDIAPTLLSLLSLKQPAAMTGSNLLKLKE